jgi:NAD(P)-dependent dehydrogenase (short-subunit alcohol dehydrogenase family)
VAAPRRLLRAGLLDGLEVLAAPRTSVTDACAGLGAHVAALEVDLLDAEAATAAATDTEATVLVVDAAALFGGGGAAALRVALDSTWSAIHASFAPQRTEKIVLVAPRPGAGDYAQALRAGLENLARTLSIEWSRFGVRVTALLPGEETADGEAGELVAFLASPAGDYWSGCALTLT